MALESPLVQAQTIIDELRLDEKEFDYKDGATEDQAALWARVQKAIVRASVLTQKRVGGNYTSTDDVTLAAVREAETALACHYMLRRRLMILSSRPEEAPPPEYIDLDALKGEIEAYYNEWDQICAAFEDDSMARPGVAFAFGGKGVDETLGDESEGFYDATDYGDLPS